MPFEKGKEKTGGRTKGTPNKVNAQIREMLSTLVVNSFTSVQKEFDKLGGRDKINAYIDLLPYVVPRLQATSLDLDIDKLTDEQVDELYDRIVNSLKE